MPEPPVLLPPRVLPTDKSLGKMREMSGLRAGREAQEMATLISADDQTAAPTPSRVVSGEMEISYKLLRRTILVMQTLWWVLVLEGFDDGLRCTHKLPKAKMNMRPIFWLRGSCSCFRSGMGNANTMMSVVMFRAELENQNASWFMQ